MNQKLKFMIEIIQELGAFQHKHFRTEIQFETKTGPMDLVSFVDRECEQKFREAVDKKFPGDAIMGEESHKPDENYGKYNKLWIIDPLDGTLMYQRGIPFYGPMIAYIEDGKVIFSAIFFPEMNELYYADKTGAYKNNKKIQVSSVKSISEGLFRISQNMVRRPLSDLQKKEKFSLSLGQQVDFYTGGYGFSLCASGSIDGDIFYPEIDKIWDTVPGGFLVQQAGGKVTNFGSDTWDIFNPKVIISNGLIHTEFQKLLES